METDYLFYIVFIYTITCFIYFVYKAWMLGLLLKKFLYKHNRTHDIEYLELAEKDNIWITKSRNNIRWIKWIKSQRTNNKTLTDILRKYKNLYTAMKYAVIILIILIIILCCLAGE